MLFSCIRHPSLVNKHLSARSVGRKSHSSKDVVVIKAHGEGSVMERFSAEQKKICQNAALSSSILFLLFSVTVGWVDAKAFCGK